VTVAGRGSVQTESEPPAAKVIVATATQQQARLKTVAARSTAMRWLLSRRWLLSTGVAPWGEATGGQVFTRT
jgi:hypothetical protein